MGSQNKNSMGGGSVKLWLGKEVLGILTDVVMLKLILKGEWTFPGFMGKDAEWQRY